MTRRQVLLGAGALLAAGMTACDASSDGGPTPRPTSGSPTPPPPTAEDTALRSAAADRVLVLLAAYDDALTGRGTADPTRTPLLALRGDHAQHLEALTGAVAPPAPTTDPPPATQAPAGQAPAGQAPTAQASPPPGPVPVADLLATERLAEAGHVGDVPAASRELARLLVSIAACEASHEVGLGALVTP